MRVILSLALLSSLVSSACRGGGEPAPKAPRVLGNAGGAARVSLEDPLALLPADSDLVVTIDVAALRRSALFARYRDVLRDFLVPGFADCRYDPFDDITTVTAGVPMSTTLGMFVVRGLDRERTLDCLRTSTIETRTEAIFDGEYVRLRNRSGHENLLKFLDAGNAVLQGSDAPTRQTLDQALTVGAPLRANRALVAARDGVPAGAALSFIAVPGASGITERMEETLGVPIRALTMAIHVRDVVSGHVEIELPDDATAANLVEEMRPRLAGVRQFVERYDLRAAGPRILVDVTVTEAQIKVFSDLVKAIVGAQLDGASAGPGTSP